MWTVTRESVVALEDVQPLVSGQAFLLQDLFQSQTHFGPNILESIASRLCLEIPGRDNVLRAFCFPYEVEPDVRVTLFGELGFANQLGMNS